MAWVIRETDRYQRRKLAFLSRHPELLDRYGKAIELLAHNPFHPSLRLHALQGKLAGLHTMSITLAYRVTLELEVREGLIVLVNLGAHDEVYR